MSSTAYPENACSLPGVESSEEIFIHNMSAPRCQVCHNLRFPHPETVWTSYAELQRTSSDGCRRCDLLRQVSETVCKSMDILPENTERICVSHGGNPDGGGLPVILVDGQARWHFHLMPGHRCLWPFLNSFGKLDDDPRITDCAHFIKGALKKCSDDHEYCVTSGWIGSSMSTGISKFVPKRLLAVNDHDSVNQLRLHEVSTDVMASDGMSIRYAALSHCWGRSPMIKTTKATLCDFMLEGIKWTDLPKTFQEAVSLARELGIEFLWIDSLCIIQDSIDDWAIQAAQMANIYSNAYLTIAASAADDGQQGLLNRRKTQKLNREQDGETYTVCVREPITHSLLYVGGGDQAGLISSPELKLRERAWCLQEEFLSPCVVHFTRDEIVFVCHEATTCECTPGWKPRFRLPTLLTHASWHNFLEHYTKRRVTFFADKLAAISSLARYIQSPSDAYLAGLWLSRMPTTLLWRIDGGRRPKPLDPSQSNPPSWSWASVEGTVHERILSYQESKTTAVLLGAQVYPSTSDPTGMVSGGHIILRGPLLPLEQTWKRHCASPDGGTYNFAYKDREPHFTCEPGWDRDHSSSPEEVCCYIVDDMGSEPFSHRSGIFDASVFLFVIYTGLFPRYERGTFHSIFHCLLLKVLPDLDQKQQKTMDDAGSERAFVRIGIGMLQLDRPEAEKALDRFGETVVTIF